VEHGDDPLTREPLQLLFGVHLVFKKALVPRDQRALEQLFIYANLHIAEAECGNGAVKIDRALRTGS
jgi:hypothetical protein